ncbi:Methyltransferase domain-containing protein [Ekhidna lutea]|uniref:Methyltransferase domain-containing protein n=1 Tax=Ekhidna lutea TaxID=447679 RepID=A0A239FQ61_EKHLU|nr:class I SAM-dependent methyltransferase [Ekhidna lutea]SNS59077.1 Methyltransferase domain-containing protein [Ekhidna lutea]
MKRILPVIKFKFSLPSAKRLESEFHYSTSKKLTKVERAKEPKRTEIINYLISFLDREVTYLEIGVRNPEENFNHIKAHTKYSVDPGLEVKVNTADFPMTSDGFFEALDNGDVLSKETKFDVIFIDGLHLANQVNKDIENALRYLTDDGFIVLHDCNPPSEWHARETYYYIDTPAGSFWNGTTWKAFLKWRFNPEVYSCCIDSDWGVGILSQKHKIGNSIAPTNIFYEYNDLKENRVELMNLIDFDQLKKSLNNA